MIQQELFDGIIIGAAGASGLWLAILVTMRKSWENTANRMYERGFSVGMNHERSKGVMK